MRYGRLAKVGYAGCTAAAAPARYQVTLPLQGALISLNYHHLRRAAISFIISMLRLRSNSSSCLNSELSLGDTVRHNLVFSLVRVRQLCILNWLSLACKANYNKVQPTRSMVLQRTDAEINKCISFKKDHIMLSFHSASVLYRTIQFNFSTFFKIHHFSSLQSTSTGWNSFVKRRDSE